MFIPYHVDVPMRRWPLVNFGIIGVNIAVFVVSMDMPASELIKLVMPRTGFNFLQIISSMFLHANLEHLIFNLLFLFVFGNAINARLGQLQYAGAYIACGMVSALAWVAFGPGEYLLGASGAIMGMVGLFGILYPRNDVRVGYCIFFRFGSFAVSSIWIILLYLVLDFAGFAQSEGGVAHVAHIGGMLFGAAVAITLILANVVKPDPNEQNLLQVINLRPR